MSTPSKAAPVAAITSEQVRRFLEQCRCPYSKTALKNIAIVPESFPSLTNFNVVSTDKKIVGDDKFIIVAGVIQDGEKVQVFTVYCLL